MRRVMQELELVVSIPFNTLPIWSVISISLSRTNSSFLVRLSRTCTDGSYPLIYKHAYIHAWWTSKHRLLFFSRSINLYLFQFSLSIYCVFFTIHRVSILFNWCTSLWVNFFQLTSKFSPLQVKLLFLKSLIYNIRVDFLFRVWNTVCLL